MLRSRHFRKDVQPAAHRQLGQGEASADTFLELLSLNPDDHQGVRTWAVPQLILLGRDDEAAGILERFTDERNIWDSFGRALVAFKKKGDSKKARGLLERAFDEDHDAAVFLLEPDELRADVSEGLIEAGTSGALDFWVKSHPAWEGTPGAIKWLREVLGVYDDRDEDDSGLVQE